MSAFVILAKLGRPHGVPTPEAVSFRCELYARGGEVFRGLREIYVAQSTATDTQEENTFKKYTLVREPKSLGGGWGHAQAVILSFSPQNFPATHSELAVPREYLPDLDDDEFYIQDLMGREVVDHTQKSWGRVVRVFDQQGSYSLELQKYTGGHIEFPMAWVDEDSILGQGPLVVEDLESWDLDPRLPNDENKSDGAHD